MKGCSQPLIRVGFLTFWAQIILSCVSGVILLFTAGFLNQDINKLALYFANIGLFLGFIGSFCSRSYAKSARKMRLYIDFKEGKIPEEKLVTRKDILTSILQCLSINLLGSLFS